MSMGGKGSINVHLFWVPSLRIKHLFLVIKIVFGCVIMNQLVIYVNNLELLMEFMKDISSLAYKISSNCENIKLMPGHDQVE